MARVTSRRSGFTLMEATVALAVFTVGMLGLAGAFTQIVKANTMSIQKQMSALLAERQMARFRTAGTGDLLQTSGAFENPFEEYAWEARFSSQSQDLEIVDVWIEVKHHSGVGVGLWSQIVVADEQRRAN